MNDSTSETPRQPPGRAVVTTSGGAGGPGKPARDDEKRPAAPPEPGPEQAPHEHPDDPGVHPDGPKRYHDDHATPARQRLEQGEPA